MREKRKAGHTAIRPSV